nr:MAG TPA: hypothetical protein [Caudoviricetes sp.]
MNEPLRYNISDWHQLTSCQSNTCRDLRILISDFIQDDRLSGVRIQIYHDNYGVIFSYITNASGTMLSCHPDCNMHSEFSTSLILSELAKYGFFVTFNPKPYLSGDLLQYLMSIKSFGFDKLRILSVYTIENHIQKYKSYVVAFNVDLNPKWLDTMYCASNDEFLKSIANASALNISALSQTRKWNWSWLDYIADINDILEDNA